MEVLAGRMQNLVEKAQFERVAGRKALQQCAKELVHEVQTQTAYLVMELEAAKKRGAPVTEPIINAVSIIISLLLLSASSTAPRLNDESAVST